MKVDMTKIMTIAVIIAILFYLCTFAILLIPWYEREDPMRLVNKEKIYKPGDAVKLEFSRKSLINMQARISRELVRIHEDSTEEVWTVNLNTSVNKGKDLIKLQYFIPSLDQCPVMRSNTYKWRGTIVYRPLGLIEKTVSFETEPFQIEVPDG